MTLGLRSPCGPRRGIGGSRRHGTGTSRRASTDACTPGSPFSLPVSLNQPAVHSHMLPVMLYSPYRSARTRRPARCRSSRRQACSGRELALPDVHAVLAARLELVAPGNGCARAHHGPRTPTRPRWQPLPPIRSRRPRRSTSRARPDGRRARRARLRALGMAPVGALDLAPPRRGATPRVGGKSSGSSPPKTKDQP